MPSGAGLTALGFVYLNPNHVEFSLEEFDRCVRDGPMVGVKLWVAKRCSAPELDPIVDRAAAVQAVILQHCWFNLKGNLPGESTPHDLVELAARHPKAIVHRRPHRRRLGTRDPCHPACE